MYRGRYLCFLDRPGRRLEPCCVGRPLGCIADNIFEKRWWRLLFFFFSVHGLREVWVGWEEWPAYLLPGLRPRGIGSMRSCRAPWLNTKDARRSYVKFQNGLQEASLCRCRQFGDAVSKRILITICACCIFHAIGFWPYVLARSIHFNRSEVICHAACTRV